MDTKNYKGGTLLEFSTNLRGFCRCVSAGFGAGLGRRRGRHGHQELQGRNAVRIFNQSKRVLPLRFRRPRRRPGRRPPAQAGGQAGTDTKNHKGETRVDFSNNLTAFALWVPPACRPAGLLKEFVFFKNPLRIQGRQAGGSKMAKTAALRV